MSRELSDVIIILIAILIPTMATLIGVAVPKILAHRERASKIAAENRMLRADLAAVKGRVADVERIVTDDGHRLSHEIDGLRTTSN